MDAISYRTAQTHLARTMDRVCDDREPLVITRTHAPSVVLISLEEYRALEEAAGLLRKPANAAPLLSAVAAPLNHHD